MAPTIPQFQWQTMTPVVNETKTPNRFLRDLLFSDEQALSTEAIAYDLLTGDRKQAPFVEKNAQAIPVEGYGEAFQTVEPPNIRIKRAMHAANEFFRRGPGTPVFIDQARQRSEIDRRVARDLRRLVEMRDNAIEWLVAQAIRGTIEYQVSDQASFKITYPKPGAHNITLTTFWDQPNSVPENDFLDAAHLISSNADLPITHAIMGWEAARVFRTHAKILGLLDTKNVTAGNVDLTQKFTAMGALYLGTFCGVPCWAYPRKAEIGGTTEDLIRPKYVEFVSATPAAENVLYFGAIADWDAYEGAAFATASFSKSWILEDPSVRIALLASRPLPVPRRPASMVSMKVISG